MLHCCCCCSALCFNPGCLFFLTVLATSLGPSPLSSTQFQQSFHCCTVCLVWLALEVRDFPYGVALLVEDPPQWNSTFMQNQPIWDPPLYFVITFEPIMQIPHDKVFQDDFTDLPYVYIECVHKKVITLYGLQYIICHIPDK